AYGAIAVVVTGTTMRPNVQLKAANPGFGIGLRNVSATVRSTAGGWAIQASGESAYGPFVTDVTILASRGPMTIDIRRLVFAGVRSSNFLIRTARARIDYRNGTGTAQVVADGSSGVPFQVAVNAALTPELIRAAAQGNVNRIPFRLARPAEIRKAGGDWVLAPVQVVLPQGNVLLAGRMGASGMTVQSRLQNLDLSIVNAFSPGLGIGGRATGSLHLAQPGSAFPQAEARPTNNNFPRTGRARRPTPVDMAVLGT